MSLRARRSALLAGVLTALLVLPAGVAAAASPSAPTAPRTPSTPGVTVNLTGLVGKPSSSLTIILAITVLSVAPTLLLLTTCFTKVFVVLGLTRNALGVQSVPPNQVLAGIALFVSLFIMAPVLSDMNKDGVQPYLHGEKTQAQAYKDGVAPLHDFMVKKTRKEELALFTKVAQKGKPKDAASVPLSTLIPAFILSELKSAFIIGFVIFIPFLVIDIVVSAGLMSMGMMMLPPAMISLPFKMLLFVLVDGWSLVITSLVQSYH
ncbi:flagellar biosynthetic protein FliP [Motilibacter rhizosphaerae]|uniref:Flagellar biosynthetic protein FliP n=1 Tax=Motilibacter rhizosphaerae TaxID=598652 RepID=A0A4V2F535_9ACTN|nr:flagellar type III secretion system pore protein FliP [Motilibacter rhizosphaerae]RZS91439.1 flagellar biosynthetic protein FliP [Motilibacter rhizosphaerae]